MFADLVEHPAEVGFDLAEVGLGQALRVEDPPPGVFVARERGNGRTVVSASQVSIRLAARDPALLHQRPVRHEPPEHEGFPRLAHVFEDVTSAYAADFPYCLADANHRSRFRPASAGSCAR